VAGSTAIWAGCIDRDLAAFEPAPEIIHMSAEADALNEQIKQSVALLRRHL
jgi:hypothetical protein